VRLTKQLEEAQQRKVGLERQQRLTEQRLIEQQQNEQRLAEQKKAAETKVAVALPPPPAPEIPKPQPMQEAPKPAIPTPSVPAQSAPTPVTTPAAAAAMEPAKMVSQVMPVFPRRAAQMRWEPSQDHVVQLKVFVSEQGQPLKVSVTQSVPGTYGFDEAAIEAANKSTYAPATRDSKPLRGWTSEIIFKFSRQI